jgi:mycoredoxin
VTHWAAQDRHVRDGVPIIYIRPISLDCFVLRLVLGRRAKKAVWVDIWADDEAAAFVRDLNDGREVVPTVILSTGDAVSKPDPATVARDLTGRLPE